MVDVESKQRGNNSRAARTARDSYQRSNIITVNLNAISGKLEVPSTAEMRGSGNQSVLLFSARQTLSCRKLIASIGACQTLSKSSVPVTDLQTQSRVGPLPL